jgi:hypothetical protein
MGPRRGFGCGGAERGEGQGGTPADAAVGGAARVELVALDRVGRGVEQRLLALAEGESTAEDAQGRTK